MTAKPVYDLLSDDGAPSAYPIRLLMCTEIRERRVRMVKPITVTFLPAL